LVGEVLLHVVEHHLVDYMYKLFDELARNEDNCLVDIFALQGFQDDMERSLARRIDW